jgi:curved DNA-binding protein CbpA
VANPYEVLGIDASASDDEVRRRYLALVRCYSPEHEPEAFQRIRAAYEAVSDEGARLRFLLFDRSHGESLEEWMEEIRCQESAKRPGLDEIRALFRKS